jgi:hypothetical protein
MTGVSLEAVQPVPLFIESLKVCFCAKVFG